MEEEIKLLSTPEGRKKVFSLPEVQKKIIPGTKKTLHLRNQYYDTADKVLTQEKLAYRIRQIDGKSCEATVKTAGKTENGFSCREEYTAALTEPLPVLHGFSADMDCRLQQLAGQQTLEPFCTIAFTRHLALLQITEETVVELSADEGGIRAGSGRAPVEELEVELKRGKKEDLLSFVNALKKKIPLWPENRSKLLRALLLLKQK